MPRVPVLAIHLCALVPSKQLLALCLYLATVEEEKWKELRPIGREAQYLPLLTFAASGLCQHAMIRDVAEKFQVRTACGK